MVGRRPKLPKKTKVMLRPSAEARAFVVVLEEIRTHIKVIGEGQELLREEQQRMRDEQQRAGNELQRMGNELQRTRDQMATGFAEVHQRFDRVEQDVGLLKIAALDHSRELKELRVALDRKVDRDEVEGIVQRVSAGHR